MPLMVHKPSTVDVVLNTSNVLLSALKDVSGLTPIPFLQDAATIALSIVNIAQDLKSNKNSFLRLANDACELVYAILCTGPTGRAATPAPSFLDHLQELTSTLVEIQKIAKKQASRNWLLRIIMHKADLATVQGYREILRQSLDVFGLKANISIHENLAQLQNIMEQMQENADAERVKHEEEEKVRKKREEADRVKREEHELQLWLLEKEREETEKKDVRRAAEDEKWPRRKNSALGESPRSTTTQIGQEYPFPHAYDESAPSHRMSPYLPLHSPFPKNGIITSIGGDHNVYSNHISHSNPGNMTTNLSFNSNNNTSVRLSN